MSYYLNYILSNLGLTNFTNDCKDDLIDHAPIDNDAEYIKIKKHDYKNYQRFNSFKRFTLKRKPKKLKENKNNNNNNQPIKDKEVYKTKYPKKQKYYRIASLNLSKKNKLIRKDNCNPRYSKTNFIHR